MLEDFKQQLKRNGEVYLSLRIRPRAAQTKIKQVMTDETIKIDVAAVPVKGKANAALVKFLAKEFAVPAEQVMIMAGVGESSKLVKLRK